MPLLSKSAILMAADLPQEDVAVPEWGGTIRLRSLTGAERDAFEAAVFGRDGDPEAPHRVNYLNMRARLVALSAIGEDGQRLFEDGDIEALGKKNAAALDRLFDVCQRLSGITEHDVKALEKNSEAALIGSMPSGSLNASGTSA